MKGRSITGHSGDTTRERETELEPLRSEETLEGGWVSSSPEKRVPVPLIQSTPVNKGDDNQGRLYPSRLVVN